MDELANSEHCPKTGIDSSNHTKKWFKMYRCVDRQIDTTANQDIDLYCGKNGKVICLVLLSNQLVLQHK